MHLDAFQHSMLSLKQQAELKNNWLRDRLETILPALLKRSRIDMWLIICREYNEDPVIMSLLPAPAMSARRRTILAFCRNADDSVDRLTLHRYGYGDFYQAVWNPDQEDQWDCLSRIVRERDPQNIAVNFSPEFAFADGLTYTEASMLNDALGEYSKRVISGEDLALGWLETRTPNELHAYPHLIEMGHALIAEAFSTRVIHPGVTTTDDVIWWMRQRMHDYGLQAWFQPDVEIQAIGQSFDFLQAPARKLIMPGDLLWCDVGFTYLGLTTDQQQHAYVLKAGETEAPQGLQDALADGNRLQDIHLSAMRVGQTGNQVLNNILAQAQKEHINAQVYSHPLGFHGHAAGPTIGLWDQQGGVAGKGDYPLYDNTVYSIELNIKKSIPEWDGQEIRIALEEDAMLVDGQISWLHGRQTQFHLIG